MPDQPEPRTVESGQVNLTAVSAVADSITSDAQPVDPVADSTSSDDGDFVSIQELQQMSYEDLKQFCADNQIAVPGNIDNAPDLLDWLLVEFGVDA